MKNFSILIVIIAFASCHSQNNEVVDLAQIPDDFKVSDFFKGRLKETAEITAFDVDNADQEEVAQHLEENADKTLFTKDTLGLYDPEGRYPTPLFLESTNDVMVSDQKPQKIVGFGYYTTAIMGNEKEPLATLNMVEFPWLNMFENKEGGLMYVKVEKEVDSVEDYEKIKGYLEENAEPITVDEFYAKGRLYWENDSFYYVLYGDKTGGTGTLRLTMYTKDYVQKMKNENVYAPGQEIWSE